MICGDPCRGGGQGGRHSLQELGHWALESRGRNPTDGPCPHHQTLLHLWRGARARSSSLPSFSASLWLLRSGRLRGAAFWKLICSLILTQHPAWHQLFRVMINKDSGRHWGWGEKRRRRGPSSRTYVNVRPGMTVRSPDVPFSAITWQFNRNAILGSHLWQFWLWSPSIDPLKTLPLDSDASRSGTATVDHTF